MKKYATLLYILLVFACANLSSEQYEIRYAFSAIENVTDKDSARIIEVLKKRLGKYHEYVAVRMDKDQQIIVTLKAGFDIDALNQIVENQGKLDFWPCVSKEKMIHLVAKLDSITKNDTIPNWLPSMLQSFNPEGFPVFMEEDLSNLRKRLESDKVKSIFVGDYKDVKLLFGLPIEGYMELYAVESNSTGRAPVNEGHILESRQDYDQMGRPAVSLKMNEYGAYKWYQMTNDAFKNDTKIALTLNDIVYSAPGVSSGPISGGLTQIAGDFTLDQAIDLSNVLSSQQMIPKLKFVNMTKVVNQ